MSSLPEVTSIWESYANHDPKNPPIIELINANRVPVGAIYLNSFNLANVTVALSQTNNSEKYALYYNGILVYFSYYRKLTLK